MQKARKDRKLEIEKIRKIKNGRQIKINLGC